MGARRRPAYGSVNGMVKTTVYLPENLKASLERAAAERGRSETELDFLIATLAGEAAELELIAEFSRGAYGLAEMGRDDVEQSLGIIRRHPGLGVGLADASIAVLSRRLGCLDVLTLDERHFHVLRGAGEKLFRLLPADG